MDLPLFEQFGQWRIRDLPKNRNFIDAQTIHNSSRIELKVNLFTTSRKEKESE